MGKIVTAIAAFIVVWMVSASFGAQAMAQQACNGIEFPIGKDVTVVSGSVAPDTAICYRLDAEIGQEFNLKVLRGKNTVLTVINVQDAEDHISFTARQPSYEIHVVQLMRAAIAEKFRLSIRRGKGDGQPAAEASAVAKAPSAGAGAAFRDCEHCPELVPLPSGTFMMGATPQEVKKLRYVQSALPRHEVTIGYPFAIGRFEVTVDEFDAYVKETGAKVGGKCGVRVMESGPSAFKYSGTPIPGGDKTKDAPYVIYIADGSYQQPGLPVTGRQPAGCVSRNEMKGYLAWLSGKSGKHYRLPTEAEWEYAYRAGTDTMNYWGDDFRKTCDYANFADRKSGYQAGMAASCSENIHPDWTGEVGSYKPNPWGLYDMAGNAQETVEDCLHHDYEGAPTDGSPWTAEGCVIFVARSGDYELTQFSMRAAERLLFGYTADANEGMWTPAEGSDERFNNMGFRVAVSLDGTSWDKEARPGAAGRPASIK
jgi:formylglycine-generating enzyme required for sulfatase activity